MEKKIYIKPNVLSIEMDKSICLMGASEDAYVPPSDPPGRGGRNRSAATSSQQDSELYTNPFGD